MNVFVLSSWLPHRCFPLEGIFARDQASAMASLHPDWRVVQSRWAQGAGFLSLSHLRRSPWCWLEVLRAPGRSVDPDLPNLNEVFRPVPTWTERWRGGNRDGILAVNRRNLAEAAAVVGPIDVLHAHGSYPAGWVALRLSREHGIPYVVTEHMGPFPLPVYRRPDGTLRPTLREPLERADATLAVSDELADAIAGHGLARPQVVPNLVDERLHRVETRAAGGAFTVFTLCGMEKGKAVDDLLRAIARFVAARPVAPVRFRIGGDGPELDALKELSRALGLDAWVTWLGFLTRDEARREFAACDAFALASRHESFGIVFVEAMASGKPVLATRCGGPETIVTPETGLLVEVGDVEAIAAGLSHLVDQATRYDPAVIRGIFEARYSRPAVVARLESIYRGVLERARSSPLAAVGG